jgi:hypothetical protein
VDAGVLPGTLTASIDCSVRVGALTAVFADGAATIRYSPDRSRTSAASASVGSAVGSSALVST